MNKFKNPSLVNVAQITTGIGILTLVTSVIMQLVFLFNADLMSMSNPASSPLFSASSYVMTASFFFAVAAALLTVIGIIRTVSDPRRHGPRKNNQIIITLVVSAILIIATVQAGAVPFLSSINTEPETLSQEEKQILKDDVDVQIGTYNEHMNAIPVIVTNKRSDAKDYIIVIDAYNKYGHRLAQDSVYTMDLGPHESNTYKILQSSYAKVTPEQLSKATFVVSSVTRQDISR